MAGGWSAWTHLNLQRTRGGWSSWTRGQDREEGPGKHGQADTDPALPAYNLR